MRNGLGTQISSSLCQFLLDNDSIVPAPYLRDHRVLLNPNDQQAEWKECERVSLLNQIAPHGVGDSSHLMIEICKVFDGQ